MHGLGPWQMAGPCTRARGHCVTLSNTKKTFIAPDSETMASSLLLLLLLGMVYSTCRQGAVTCLCRMTCMPSWHAFLEQQLDRRQTVHSWQTPSMAPLVLDTRTPCLHISAMQPRTGSLCAKQMLSLQGFS